MIMKDENKYDLIFADLDMPRMSGFEPAKKLKREQDVMKDLNTDIRVLVVDDYPLMRTMLKKLLKQLGYMYIDEAADGDQAFSMLQNGDFGLVVSDWYMPGLEGIELLRMVRQDDKLKNTPFLMMTAEPVKGKILEAIKEGVDNYLVKPFTAEGLKEKLKKVAEKRPTLRAS